MRWMIVETSCADLPMVRLQNLAGDRPGEAFALALPFVSTGSTYTRSQAPSLSVTSISP
jgi:hypothetical protein